MVGIAGSADRDALFPVQTGSNHALFHGACTSAIDARSIRPGETARVGKMPAFFRDVTIPEFEPYLWRGFIPTALRIPGTVRRPLAAATHRGRG